MTCSKLKLQFMCSSWEVYLCVLILAEIIFFIACIVTCFGFVMKTVFITQGHFSYYWTLSIPPITLPASRLGVRKKLGGDTVGAADPNWAKGYSVPYEVMLSNWGWEKKEEGEMFKFTAFVFPSNCYVWWSPAFLEITKYLSDDVK